MNKILLIFLLTLLGLGCSIIQSKNVEPNKKAENIQVKATPPKENKNISNEADLANANPAILPINDADYVATKLVENKMTQTTLDGQLPKIIEQIFMNESTEKNKWRSPKNAKAKIENRDFNGDGDPERIIISRLYSEKGVPVLYIFNSDNELIFQRDLGVPYSDSDIETEFLTKSGKNEFDLIKLTENLGTDEELKETTYYKMNKKGYEPIECHKIEGKSDKIIPCSF